MRFPQPGRMRDVESFRARIRELALDLECVEEPRGAAGPLGASARLFGRELTNRFAIHPMEGWDGTLVGRPSEATLRRWRHFGASGAALVWGGEAFAVQPDGRANPNQLARCPGVDVAAELAALREVLLRGARDVGGDANVPCIGLQLTHSGHYARPTCAGPEPKAATADATLDRRLPHGAELRIASDGELEAIAQSYVETARLASAVGFDFVDVKACHGYLLHELLGARARPGPYGGSLANRSRLMLGIVRAIRAACPALGIGVRLSVGDPAPRRRVSEDGESERDERDANCGFGRELADGEFDLAEPIELVRELVSAGVGALSVTLGSPYYCPHVQRPAAYPPSDGYEPPRDPLCEVALHLRATAAMKRAFPELPIVGAGYTYLQEWLPHVAERELECRRVDFVGIGRMVLSYPEFPRDVLAGRELDRRKLCRTFSDCTTAPRNGLPSGCYPLDDFYRRGPDAERLAGAKERRRER